MTAALDLRTLSLVDLLPPAIASDEDIIALSLALDPELRAVSAAIEEAIIWPNVDNLPEAVLDVLAWDCRLNELQIWDDATLAGKRALLKNIFAIRKKSGTRYAVRRIFDLLSVVGELIEWWQEGASHDTYRIRLHVEGDPGLTLHQLQQIPELLARFARTSQSLSELAVESNTPAPLALGCVPCVGVHMVIGFGV